MVRCGNVLFVVLVLVRSASREATDCLRLSDSMMCVAGRGTLCLRRRSTCKIGVRWRRVPGAGCRVNATRRSAFLREEGGGAQAVVAQRAEAIALMTIRSHA